MFQELFGDLLAHYENVLKDCPRVVEELFPVCAEIISIFDDDKLDDASKDEAAKEAMRPLQEEEYGDYYHPHPNTYSTSECMDVMERMVRDHDVPVIERGTFDAFEANQEERLHSIFDMSLEIDLIPDDWHALSMIKTKDGKDCIICAHHFTLATKEQSIQGRFSAGRSYLAFTGLLHDTGNMTQEVYDCLLRLLTAFLMQIDNSDKDEDSQFDGVREARNRMFPLGTFNPAIQEFCTIQRTGFGCQGYNLFILARGSW